jgi:hypothetical protein
MLSHAALAEPLLTEKVAPPSCGWRETSAASVISITSFHAEMVNVPRRGSQEPSAIEEPNCCPGALVGGT